MLPCALPFSVTPRRVEWDLGISQAASPRRLRRPLPRPRAIRWYGAWSRHQPTFLARAHDGGDVTVTSELGKGSGFTPTD